MSSEYEYEYLFKIILVGDSGVGKTSLFSRYTDDIFTESFISTIGIDFKMKTITVKNKKVRLQIWDTAGQERFRTIVQSYYRGAQSIIIVFDITDIKSFENVKCWLSEINKYVLDEQFAQILLVGNKNDLATRAVSYELAKQFAIENQMKYIETSAKSSSNVEKAFLDWANNWTPPRIKRDLQGSKMLAQHHGQPFVLQPPFTKSCCK
jgi:Ras-related protein Rab-1A